MEKKYRISGGLAIVDGAYAALGRKWDVCMGLLGGEGRERCEGICMHLVFGLDIKLDFFTRQGAHSKRVPLLACGLEEGRRGRRSYLMFMVVVLELWLWGWWLVC